MWDFEKGESMSEQEKVQLLGELVKDLSFWGPLPSSSSPTKKQSATHKSTMSDASSRNGQPVWRTAVDSTTGKTYYYDAVSRRTQWEKPHEIREMERKRRQEKKNQDRLFFNQMEQNIRKSLEKGLPVETASSSSSPEEDLPSPPPKKPPIRSRTISGMDECLLQELQSTAPPPSNFVVVPNKSRRDAHGRPPLPVRRFSTQPSEVSLEFSPEESRHTATAVHVVQNNNEHPLLLQREDSDTTDTTELRGEALLDGPIIDEEVYNGGGEVVGGLPKNQQQHVRRNTGGTIFAESTMMNPDVEKTIKCVCGVYRAHIIQASTKRSKRSPVSVAQSRNQGLGEIFLDHCPATEIPSLEDIITFYHDFYVRSQMEHDTIIMSLIYVERLIKEDTNISPVPENWRSVLFSCMVLASKVWDDLSMWNIDFSNVCGRGGGLAVYTLPRINQLELALLKALNFNVKVPASEYAKYYFLIRSMLIKSGLLLTSNANTTEEKPTTTSSTTPHQKETAAAPKKSVGHRIARSMNDQQWQQKMDSEQSRSTVCLEQLLSMTTY